MSTTTAEPVPSRAVPVPMSFSIKVDPSTGQQYMAVSQKGRELLLNPLTNKGTAFTRRERDELDLDGLVPPAVCTMHQQLDRTYENFKVKTTNLEKFIYLSSLQDRNETLFYRLVLEHIDEMMPIVYTPVVGEACQKYSHIYRRGRGLYIAYEDRDRIEEILLNAGIPNPSVIVVTDGERILGLGDQGAGGMGIPIGKLCLYTLCAGVSPYSTLPITLDVGTNNQERLNDPLYLGMRHARVRGAEYQAFIDAFVAAVKKVFPRVVLQWEDFLKENALFQLARFRDQLCTFNDDIQGTAAVVLAGVYGALRITGQRMRDQRVVFAGAGASTQGIAELLVAALMEDGLTHEEAVRCIWTTDSHGLVSRSRPSLEQYKATYARPAEEVAGYACKDRSAITLLETVENAKPTMLIGTSATPGIFDEAGGPGHGPAQRPAHRLPALEPDLEDRVHAGGRPPLVGGAGDRGHRQPVRSGRRGRQAPPHRAVQQLLRLPGRRAGADGERRAARVERHVPRGRQGARRHGDARGPRRVRRLPAAVADPGLLVRRGLRDDPPGRGGRPRGPGDPRAPREDGRAGHVVPGVPAAALRAVATPRNSGRGGGARGRPSSGALDGPRRAW